MSDKSLETAATFASVLMADAIVADIPLEPVDPSQVPAIEGAGNPSTGAVVLGSLDRRELGVWEMTVGAMTDVEVDEVCVIVAGAGTIERTIDGQAVTQALTPGTVLRLRDGEETLWRVTETLRKIYLT